MRPGGAENEAVARKTAPAPALLPPLLGAGSMGTHRRTLSAASNATDGTDCASWHDAQETLEGLDLDSAHEEAEACGTHWETHEEAQGKQTADAPRVAVDWGDEAQMLPPNHLSVEERLAHIHSLRKIVLAEPDAGACCGASVAPCGLRFWRKALCSRR